MRKFRSQSVGEIAPQTSEVSLDVLEIMARVEGGQLAPAEADRLLSELDEHRGSSTFLRSFLAADA